MIDEMVTSLQKEQGNDDSLKVYCLEGFDKTQHDAKTIVGHEQLSNIDARTEVVQKSIAEFGGRQKQRSELVTLIANRYARVVEVVDWIQTVTGSSVGDASLSGSIMARFCVS